MLKYFLLFKVIAEQTAQATFIQLVETWCNASGGVNFQVVKLTGYGCKRKTTSLA